MIDEIWVENDEYFGFPVVKYSCAFSLCLPTKIQIICTSQDKWGAPFGGPDGLGNISTDWDVPNNVISVNGADQVLHIEGGNMGSAWRNYASLLQKTQLIHC